MLETPAIVHSAPQATVVIHLTIPRPGIIRAMPAAMAELAGVLRAQGIAPSGPCYSYHWRRPGEIFDFEVGFPVEQVVAPAGRVRMSSLPASRVARTIHHGGYDGLAEAWGSFCKRVDEAGLNPREDLWERYLVGPNDSTDPADWRTELNRPLND